MPDIQLHYLWKSCHRLHCIKRQTMSRMNFETKGVRKGGHFPQTLKFLIPLLKPAFGMRIAIGTGMQLNYWCSNPGGGLNLPPVCCDEDRNTASNIGKRSNEVRKPVLFTRNLKAAFCRPFFSLFRDEANRVWLMTKGYSLHLVRCCHFEIERHRKRIHQTFDISVRDVASVFPKMCSDPIGPCILRKFRSAYRIRCVSATCIPDGGYVIDIHAKAQQSQWCDFYHVIPRILTMALTLGAFFNQFCSLAPQYSLLCARNQTRAPPRLIGCNQWSC